MPNLTSVVTNYFPTSSETYSNNINASITAGAATVPVNAASTYTDGDIVVLTVDPGLSAQATFIGVKASTPDRFINCFWTEGNVGVGHSNGAVITDYDSATHQAVVTKGIRAFANNDGTLKTTAVQAALNLGTASLNGWNALGYAPTAVTHLGCRNYTVQINGIDLTGTLSPSMRLRATRTIAAPTQCSLLNGTNQSWLRNTTITGMTFTDNWSASAWVKLTNYQTGAIIARHNGTTGFYFAVTSSGQLIMRSQNGVGAKDTVTTQYLPLNRWVHVAGSHNVGGASYKSYIDGADVLNSTAGAATGVTQAGNLEVGSNSIVGFFPGRLAQVAVFNAVLTNATILGLSNQGLVGNEANLISGYSLSGNGNDLNTTNVNHLTAQNGATATTADAPFGTQADATISTTLDYAVIQKVAFTGGNTIINVQVQDGDTFATSGISALVYSSNHAPYGMPLNSDNLGNMSMSTNLASFNPTATDQDLASQNLLIGVFAAKPMRILVNVEMGLASTADVEFRPEVRLNGAIVYTYSPTAAPGFAGNRATSRGFVYPVTVPAGYSKISAGLLISSGAGWLISTNGAFISAWSSSDMVYIL